MKKGSHTLTGPQGFSLIEVLVSLLIAAMILVTMLGIYNRAESVAATITRKLDSSKLQSEILQRIAEDLDRIITNDASVTISIKNKFVKGYPTAQLAITKTIVDAKKKAMIFENIIWQTNYDYDAGGLILYRHRTSELGLLEDQLFDQEREVWEQGLFVPICDGITFFKIQAISNGKLLDKWNGRMPPGVEVTISFAEPFKALNNTWEVFDEEKVTRVIAIDRTRKIKFKIAPIEKKKSQDDFAEGAEELEGEEELKGLEKSGGAGEPRTSGNPVGPKKPIRR
ncbi:MAG: prepilin-type N-terminal cleavage/methylation domain-containing protein [Planctomycetes bacterium]|nr:prepilin-type N-terminal cleavage/methylation domain-containing protein [Planctomycetota bacterium]